MSIYFINNKNICEYSSGEKIKIADQLTIDFIRIFVKSKHFDKIGLSEVMIVNHVKTIQTKERSVESIVYYDNDAKVINKKYWETGPFSNDEYGNSVCYHTEGYIGNDISMTFKIWELNSKNTFDELFSFVKNIFKLSPNTQVSNIVSTGLDISQKILNNNIQHKELCKEYTLKLQGDILLGKYIIFPNLSFIESKEIIQNASIEHDLLIDKNTSKHINQTYYIINISNDKRVDLIDFDYLASSNELIKLLNNNGNNEILDINNNSHSFKLLKEYFDYTNENENEKAKAIKKQLKKLDSYSWIKTNLIK